MEDHKRVHFIDVLKTIAIIGVLFVHVRFSDVNILLAEGKKTLIFYCSRIMLSIPVPIFFFCNGYLLAGKDYDYKKHIRKLLNIVVLTVFWNVVTIAVMKYVYVMDLSVMDIIRGIYNMDLQNHYLWFMIAMIIIYIFYPLIKNTFDRDKKSFYFFFFIIMFLAFGNNFLVDILKIINVLVGNNITDFDCCFIGQLTGVWSFNAFTVGYFLLGMVFFDQQELITLKIKNVPKIIWIVIGIVCLISASLYAAFVSKRTEELIEIGWWGQDRILVVMALICLYFSVCQVIYKGQLYQRVIRNIAQNTMGIYFVHWIPMQIANKLLLNYNNNPIIVFAEAIFVFLVSYGLTLILCKIPLLKRIVKI